MIYKYLALVSVVVGSANAFTLAPATRFARNVGVNAATDIDLLAEQVDYQPGKADTEFARRYGHLAGVQFKTVGEAMADFTENLGHSINALYKSAITDLVGTTHLITVCARFERDPVWCAGILMSLDVLLKNYPEQDIAKRIASALFKSAGLDEEEVRKDGKMIVDWARSVTREDVEKALTGEGDSPLAEVVRNAQKDEYWMYSRYFAMGLLKIMEEVGVEMDKNECFNLMEDWMGKKMGKPCMTACMDSDLYFKIKSKLDMMETMMKEIEIREKKKMAERLEQKAEAALKAAEVEKKFEEELANDPASKDMAAKE